MIKKLVTLFVALVFLGCAATYPPPVVAQQQPDKLEATPVGSSQVELQQMELRALVAEINLLRQQIAEKTQRARVLQGQLQAEQLRQEQAAKAKKK